MMMGTGLKTAFDASVLSASAGAFALALLGPGPLSVDRGWRGAVTDPAADPPAEGGGP